MARKIATNRQVDSSDLLDFLRTRHRVILLTTRRDGSPQASPVTAGVDGEGQLVVSTYPDRAKALNARRHPAGSALVLSDDWNGEWVQVWGTFEVLDLPDALDYVLITHNHQDHCMFETLLQLRHKIKTVVVPKSSGGGLADPSLKLILQNIGFPSVREIDEMESIEVEGGRLVGLPFLGEHGDLNIRTKIAHLINLKGKSILCAADSNNVEPLLYDHIRRLVGDVDVLFLGMECDGGPLSWLYGPLLSKPLARSQDQSRRLNGSDCEKGMGIVERLRPRQVYVYAMGQEPWLTYLTSILYTEESRPIVESNKLVAECRERGIVSERLFGSKEIEV
jgi:PPOX class probable F420-dependent enzyme